MKSQILLYTFSFSIFIAGIIAIVRYKKIDISFYPFLYCVWIACINELLSFCLYKNHQITSINNNIYVLIESIFILLFFKGLRFWRKRKFIFEVIMISLIIFWISENFVLGKITVLCIYFRILYSLIIVLISINIINEILINNRKRKATFTLCVAFIIYFTFKVFIYTFWISGLSQIFLFGLFTIMIYINLLTNLIYAVAVLWMPRKVEFTLPS